MANTFKNAITGDIGTSTATIYTSPSSTTSTVIGLTLANILSSSISVSVILADNSAGTEVYLVKDAPIVAGGSLVAIGGNQKVVLEQADSIKVVASDATSVDAAISVLEIT